MAISELEWILKFLNGITNDITHGMIMNEKDKNNLFVPVSIIVNDTIDCETLALHITYIGHGKCNDNYCYHLHREWI